MPDWGTTQGAYIFFAEHLPPECMNREQELLILQLISEISKAQRCSIILQNGRSLLIRKEGNDRLLLSRYRGSICLNEKKCTIGGEGGIMISSKSEKEAVTSSGRERKRIFEYRIEKCC